MRSIKPGRGPSMMGGVGSVIAAIFGVFWTIGAVQMGAPLFFALFGVLFVVLAAVQAWYNFHNASSSNRFSTFDIVDSHEESDPLDPRRTSSNEASGDSPRYCPYCGTPLAADYQFCPECGKKLH